MRQGWRIEYSEDEEEVCIIPCPVISCWDMYVLTSHFREKGYKYWIPADHRGGYRLVKGNQQMDSYDH